LGIPSTNIGAGYFEKVLDKSANSLVILANFSEKVKRI